MKPPLSHKNINAQQPLPPGGLVLDKPCASRGIALSRCRYDYGYGYDHYTTHTKRSFDELLFSLAPRTPIVKKKKRPGAQHPGASAFSIKPRP
jgi:hypothetical protein